MAQVLRSMLHPAGRHVRSVVAAAAVLTALGGAAWADRIVNKTAVFSGLDKITGRIITFDVAINETVQFGTLTVTPRACYTRPPTEEPQTDTFVEIAEVDASNKYKPIFGGWMFASSPGLHALEHPIYDVWLMDCKGGDPVKNLVRTTPEVIDADTAAPAQGLAVPAPLPPKPGTVPRPRRRQVQKQPAPDQDVTASGQVSGQAQRDEPVSAITAQPLPPPVDAPRASDFLPQGVSPPAADN